MFVGFYLNHSHIYTHNNILYHSMQRLLYGLMLAVPALTV